MPSGNWVWTEATRAELDALQADYLRCMRRFLLVEYAIGQRLWLTLISLFPYYPTLEREASYLVMQLHVPLSD